MSDQLSGPLSRSALASANFRTYLYGNIFSVLGVWVQRLALGWQAWQLSESTVAVGLVAAGQFLPLLVLTPFFGVLADRIRTRPGAIVMHLVLAAVAAVLAILTFRGGMTIELLVVLALVHGIANSAYSPIRLALVPSLVPPEQFPSAVAISSVVFNLSRFVGPGIAGAIVAFYGLGFAYLVNAVTYLPGVIALLLIRIECAHEPQPESAGFAAQLLEGIRYTRNHATIRQVILLVGVSNFFGRGILELMPAFAAIVFDGGSGVLAALMSAAGVGAIAASLAYSTGFLRLRLHTSVVVGAVGVGGSLLLFALVTQLATGLIALALLGFFTTFVAVGSQSEVQVHVENRLRGRVLSLWTILAIGGPAVGSLAAGGLAGALGGRYTALIFAVACLLLVPLVGIRRPRQPQQPA